MAWNHIVSGSWGSRNRFRTVSEVCMRRLPVAAPVGVEAAMQGGHAMRTDEPLRAPPRLQGRGAPGFGALACEKAVQARIKRMRFARSPHTRPFLCTPLSCPGEVILTHPEVRAAVAVQILPGGHGLATRAVNCS